MKATVDWCEENYVVLPFIAEFWNTITGLALCFSSFMFYKNNKKLRGDLNDYLHKANYTLFIVGVGTMFFHGTLLYIFQLFDEIPMLLMTFDYIYILDTLTKQQLSYFYKSKYVFCSIVIISYFVHPTLQIFAFFTFFSINVFLIFVLFNKIPDKFKSKQFKSNLFALEVCGSLCLLIWITDSLFCKYINHLYLHSIWHILTSILLYITNNLFKNIIYSRSSFIRENHLYLLGYYCD